MFFPIRSDRRLKHTPIVNYALVAANVFVHLAVHSGQNPLTVRAAIDGYMLQPAGPQLHQFITYQFLHANFMHLASNMIFLYVFGNSLEDRLGKIGYLAFYLGGGVVAGLAHALTSINPVLGASGSVAAVTGAYLALFPLSNITIFYWFFIYMDTFQVSSFLLIGFQIVQNLVFHFAGAAGVAYIAHLGGYGYGFVIGMALLKMRLLPREPYDLLTMLEHRRRRAQFRAMTREGYRPWEGPAPTPTPAHGSPGKRKKGGKAASEPDPRIFELRSQIAQAAGRHDMPHAATLYAELLEADPNQVLAQQTQLDVANQMMSQGHHELAAQAYEMFLKAYHAYPQREQVQLILGLIYARYLKRPDRAAELLAAALTRLHDPEQKALAQRTLDEITPTKS